MKKSILTIALAAMMLVAFTACEQQVPNVLPDDVNYITIVQTEDAVEGKAFDPSLFNVMVYSSNPNVAPVTVSGKGYVSLTDSDAKTFAPDQKVTAVYAGKTASPLAVSVAEVLDVKVEGFPESVVQNAAMLKTSTLTASVTLSNGTELELGADDYAIWNYCQSIIRSNELPFPEEHDVIILTSGNAREWREYFCPDTEVDVVQAIVWNDSYYLAYPEEISDYASDAFIGRYTEEEMAEHLADDDERLLDLDDDIRSAINLRDLYRDTMTYTMWHDGDLWFWNR